MTTQLGLRAPGAWMWLGTWMVLGLPAVLLPTLDLNHPELAAPEVQALLLHPHQGWTQSAWSWWGTAWVHGSTMHLVQNLAGLMALIALAWRTQTPRHALLAWAMAWPLTHVGMLWRPELTTYVGMSGVLHAGAAIFALNQTLNPANLGSRLIGAILASALILKVLMENPWNTVLFLSESSAINVAPWAHFCGLMAGLLCGGATWCIWHLAPPNSSVINRH